MNNNSEVLINPFTPLKEVDYSSLEIEGIDTSDYPDFCDAYFSSGLYLDGSPISEDDLILLSCDGELIQEYVFNSLY